MKRNEWFSIAAIAMFVVSTIYSAIAVKTANEALEKIDDVVNELSRDIENDINIPNGVVEEAVKKAAERASAKAVKDASVQLINDYRKDIRNRVDNAVRDAYNGIENDVQTEVMRRIGRIDMTRMRDRIVEEAASKASDKFDKELESITARYNANLDNVSKIYGQIANGMTRKSTDSVVLTLG